MENLCAVTECLMENVKGEWLGKKSNYFLWSASFPSSKAVTKFGSSEACMAIKYLVLSKY